MYEYLADYAKHENVDEEDRIELMVRNEYGARVSNGWQDFRRKKLSFVQAISAKLIFH